MPHRQRVARPFLGKGLAAMAASAILSASAPASAQFFGLFGGEPSRPVIREAVIPPRMVAAILRAQGFALTETPMRQGDRIIALGEDGRGQLMRFVIDAYDGAVIRTALVGAPRPPGFIGGESRAYASRGGVIFNEPGPLSGAPAQARPKPKPKAVAAKPPAAPAKPDTPTPEPAKAEPAKAEPAKGEAALPPAEPASPSVASPPSQATKAPAPVAPAAKDEPKPEPAPAAAKPADKPADKPQAKPAQEKPASEKPVATRAPNLAQPADIGPKVVPVKPAAAPADKPAEPPAP